MAFILLIFSFGAGGIVLSLSLTRRRKQLESFSLALELLETEMVFAANPLWLCFQNLGERIEGEVGFAFSEIAKSLAANEYDSAEEAFIAGLAKCRHRLYLTNEDRQIISKLAHNLGLTDKVRQGQRLKIIANLLETAIAEARNKEAKWQRIYGFGGWMMGLVCGLLLI